MIDKPGQVVEVQMKGIAIMGETRMMEILDDVRSVAEEAGLKDVKFDAQHERLVIPVITAEGRHQLVYVKPSGTTPRGDSLITVYAACLRLSDEDIQAKESGLAESLLRRNWEIKYGKFALAPIDDEQMVVLCCEQLLPTMDAAELDAMVRYVGAFADEFEAERKKDEY